MADLPEEDQADIPHSASELRNRENMAGQQRGGRPGSGAGGASGDPSSGPGSASGSQVSGGRSEGMYNPKGDDSPGKIPTPSDIDEAEAEADAADLYNDDGSDRGWRRRAFFKYRKRLAIGGGIAGLGVTGFVLFASVAQGPLEFVHLAQLLEKFHFASMEDAQDGRLTAIARYIHDPSKPQNTRLGIVGNIAANHLEAKINEATGLKSAYDPATGASKGYTVIEDSPQFKGKTAAEIKQTLNTEYGIDPANITEAGGTIGFDPDPGGLNVIKRYSAQTSFSRELLGESGYSKLSTHVGSRVLGKRAGWTFHPIKKLDASIQDAAVKAGKAAYDKLKEQLKQQAATDEATYEAGGDITKPGGEASAQQQQDANGKPVADPQGQQEADTVNQIKAASSQEDPTNPDTVKTFSDNLNAKVAGGLGVGAIGMACLIRNVSSSINNERHDKVVLPLMRKAGKFISMGSQVQSGQDIDTTSLGIYKQFLDTTNSQGKVTSTWDQAKSIEAENGQPQTGPDLPKSDQVFGSGGQSNPFDFFDNVPLLGTACGALNSTLGTIFSVVTGPVNYVVSGEVLKAAIPALADWLSGAPVSPVASGADFGNMVNYGARLSANDQYASAGGVPMSASDSLALKNVDSGLDQKDFQSKSIAYRLFNTTDSQTLASRLIDNQDLNVSQSVANITGSFGSIFKAAFKMPAMILSGTTHAADPPYDYHGLQQVGFTASQLGDPRFDDPFKNACYVVGGCASTGGNGILNGPDGQTYIDRAQKCFGITISNSNGVWDTDSLTQAVNFQSTDYPTSDCESNDEAWLRVRFWLLDTPTMEAYACSQGLDDQSCSDLGLTSTSSSSASDQSQASQPGTLPTGSAKDLATQLLPYIKSGKIQCNTTEATDCPDIKNTANGTSIATNGCQVDSLNPQLLGMLLELVQMGHTFVLSALCTGHSNDGLGGHVGGRAVDFNYIDGTFMGPDDVPWDSAKIAAGKALDQDIASFMPKTTGFGQVQCHPTFSFLQGFDTFPDLCHHQHVQVEG